MIAIAVAEVQRHAPFRRQGGRAGLVDGAALG